LRKSSKADRKWWHHNTCDVREGFRPCKSCFDFFNCYAC